MKILSTILPRMCGWLWFVVGGADIVKCVIFVLLVIYEKLDCKVSSCRSLEVACYIKL